MSQRDRKQDVKNEGPEAAAPAEDAAPARGPQFTARGAIPPVALDQVQAGPSASERAYGAGAAAYTQGADVHLAPGAQRNVPHEAAHVVQQRAGRVAPAGIAVNDDPGLEHEADELGEKARQ